MRHSFGSHDYLVLFETRSAVQLLPYWLYVYVSGLAYSLHPHYQSIMGVIWVPKQLKFEEEIFSKRGFQIKERSN